MPATRVFLSYSHDSPEHRRRVLALAERLRADGIDAMVDQYLEPAGPPEGWPRWTETQLRTADFVLAVCSPTYRKRVEGDVNPSEGHGVAWEGRLIYQHIYNAASENRKFIPLLLGESTPDDIPLPLQGVSSYRPEEDEGYRSLHRTLTGTRGTPRTELGAPRPAPAAWLPRLRLPATIRLPLAALFLAAILGGIWQWIRMPAEYNVQVTVLDSSGNPSPAAPTPSINATILKSPSGWTLLIRGADVPSDRKLVVRATDHGSSGEQALYLGRSPNLSATIRLTARTDWMVTGTVFDAAQHAVPGARVTIAGRSEAALTNADGSFILPAHAAEGQSVLLHVEGAGYKPVLQQHTVGSTPAIVVMER